MNAVIGQGFQDFETIAGMNDVKLYGGVPPTLFCVSVEMLVVKTDNISMSF